MRPNFILYVTDQHRADFLGCMGHGVLKTPHLDALAASGVTHDRFYVASPVCMPNRASLMTCRLPSSHGVRMNGIPLSRDNVTFVDLLREAGYDTALIGKSHLQNFTGKSAVFKAPAPRDGYHKAPPPLSEAQRHTLGDSMLYRAEHPATDDAGRFDLSLPYYGFDHVELVTRHGDGVGGHYTQWVLARDPEIASRIGAENQLPHDYVCPQAVRTAVPEELYSTTYIAERAEAWLRARLDNDRPFFLMVSFPDPHHPFNPPGKYWDMYRPEDMPTPAAFFRNDWTPPPHVSGIWEQRAGGTANLQGMGTFGCSAQEAREAQALTCGMIAMIDDAVGRLQASIADAPLAANTIAAFTTDHGDHLGDHRLLLKGAENYEQLTRVPFIWSDPAGSSGVRCNDIGQTHDIGVTLLERARIEPAFGMQGKPLAVVHGSGRDAALIQYEHQKVNPGIGPQPRLHTIRWENWRLTLIHGVQTGELYDLGNDPGEFQNLWSVGSARNIKAELIERLARLEMAAMDRAPLPLSLA